MKTLLVTGAGGGIGRAVAEAASAAGYRVGALDLDADAARATAESLENGVALSADVRDAEAVAAALSELGSVDVLVNNAGVLRTGPLIDHPPEDFRLVIDVNLNAVFVVAQAAARLMRDSGGGTTNFIIERGVMSGYSGAPSGR